MDPFVTLFTVFLALGFAGVLYIIAADKNRFLARIDLQQWRENYYLRSLPNFLQALHDNHFTKAWPQRHNALSAMYFRYRARPLLKRKPLHLRRAFLQQHVILFGLLEVLRPYLQDYILNEQYRIVSSRVMDMEDTIERETLVKFLESVQTHRARFQSTLTRYDQENLLAIIDRQLIPTLRATHAVFQEHGYCLLPAFTQLRQWQNLTGSELAQELPRIPPMHERKVAPPKPKVRAR